jgi:hypothetical protein
MGVEAAEACGWERSAVELIWGLGGYIDVDLWSNFCQTWEIG